MWLHCVAGQTLRDLVLTNRYSCRRSRSSSTRPFSIAASCGFESAASSPSSPSEGEIDCLAITVTNHCPPFSLPVAAKAKAPVARRRSR